MTRDYRFRRFAAALAFVLAFPWSASAESHHYSMTARIRPLYLFWISRSGVGDAVVTRDESREDARYSLLIGSDPDRAPRHINRWGYIEEVIHGKDARLIGLMTRSDEESLEEADANLRSEDARHSFKVIQATVEGDRASSRVTTVATPEDYTFRQLDRALDFARGASAGGVSRTLQLPPESRPGFLVAIAEAMKTRSATPIRYVYHGRLYELRQTRIRKIQRVQIGASAYDDAASGDFVITQLKDGEQTRFSMTYGTTGALAGVPLTVTYQPRWWMQVELNIDDSAAPAATARGTR